MWGSQLGWSDLSVTKQTVVIAFAEMALHLSSELECQEVGRWKKYKDEVNEWCTRKQVSAAK